MTTNGMEGQTDICTYKQMDEQKSENYIPLGIKVCQGFHKLS